MTSQHRQQLILKRKQLLRDLAEVDRQLSTCKDCEHYRADGWCGEFQVKLDSDTIERGPMECPSWKLDPIPF